MRSHWYNYTEHWFLSFALYLAFIFSPGER